MSARHQTKAVFGIATVFLFIMASMVAAPASYADELPKVLTITCYPIGSAAAILATAFSDAIEKQTGIRCRPTPADQDMARLLPVKTGEAQASIVTSATVYDASHGRGDFSKKMWGPQPLRYLFGGSAVIIGIAVRADSGIKTWDDLKGKRVCVGPGNLPLIMSAFLAYGGLSMDDVKTVQATGYTHAIKTVMSGGGDASILAVTSPIAKEWEAAPYGLRFLPMSDKAEPESGRAWARAAEFAPFMAPFHATYGTLGEGGEKWVAYYPYTMVSYGSVSEEVVYTMVKALSEGYDIYKNVKKPESEEWNLKAALDLDKPVFIPFHPGLIKLAKEKGLWTAEHDTFQTDALKAEKLRIQESK